METHAVGQKYPGWQMPYEGAHLSILPDGLQLLVSLPSLTIKDIKDFKKLIGYGLLVEEFPLIIWRFANNWLIETPLNPEKERTARKDDVKSWISEDKNAMHRTLIDGGGFIRSLNMAGLQWDFINALKNAWSESRDWQQYDAWISKMFQEKTANIWKRTIKFKHQIRLH